MANFANYYQLVKQDIDKQKAEFGKTVFPLLQSMIQRRIFDIEKTEQETKAAEQSKAVATELGVPDIKTTYTNPQTGKEEYLSAANINTILQSKLNDKDKVSAMQGKFAESGLEWKPEYAKQTPEQLASVLYSARNEKALVNAEATMPEVVARARKDNKSYDKLTGEQKIIVLDNTAKKMGKEAEWQEKVRAKYLDFQIDMQKKMLEEGLDNTTSSTGQKIVNKDYEKIMNQYGLYKGVKNATIYYQVNDQYYYLPVEYKGKNIGWVFKGTDKQVNPSYTWAKKPDDRGVVINKGVVPGVWKSKDGKTQDLRNPDMIWGYTETKQQALNGKVSLDTMSADDQTLYYLNMGKK